MFLLTAAQLAPQSEKDRSTGDPNWKTRIFQCYLKVGQSSKVWGEFNDLPLASKDNKPIKEPSKLQKKVEYGKPIRYIYYQSSFCKYKEHEKEIMQLNAVKCSDMQ